MRQTMITVLIASGTFFCVVAAIGVLRLPDLYMRISATSKAATLGCSFVLGGTALYFNDFAISAKIVATIAFLLLTAPVAGHILGRAAYFSKVPLWKGTICDDLRGRYRREGDVAPDQEKG